MSDCPRPNLYMIIEHFKNGHAAPVYQRFREKGRLAPEGLIYVSSWVSEDMSRCFQIMECADPKLLDQWIAAWSDLVDFEVTPVMTSAAAVEKTAKIVGREAADESCSRT